MKANIQQGKFGEEYRITHAALVESGLLPGEGPLGDTTATDVLEDLRLAPSSPIAPEQEAFPISDDERGIYALVTAEPQHIDELAYSAGLTISAASALMTMLELKGLVANAGSQHFVATSMRPGSRSRGSA